MGWKDTIKTTSPEAKEGGSWRDSIRDTAPPESSESSGPAFSATIDEDIDRISKAHGVDPEWLRDRQIGMGYYPEEQAEKNIAAGSHGKHLVTAASAAANSVLGEGLLGGLPSWMNKKLSSDQEAAAIDDLRKAVDHHKGKVQSIAEAALSATPSAVATKALKLGAKAAAALNMAEGARAGVMESDDGDELSGAVTGGLLTGGMIGVAEAVPKVWNGTKWVAGQVKKLVPGTEGALPIVNRATAKVATLNPFQSGSEQEIQELLDNPTLRRKAAGVDVVQESTNLAPRLSKAKETLDSTVSQRFQELERSSLEAPVSVLNDIKAAESLVTRMGEDRAIIDQNAKLYGPSVSKLYDDILHIFNTGGPKEANAKLPSYGKEITDLLSDEGAAAAKLRTLNARRHLDDFMRNRDWEKLSQYEKDAVSKARTNLDMHLKEMFSGSDARATADALFSDKQRLSDDFFKPLTSRAPSGSKFVDPSKVKGMVKTGTARGDLFEQRANDLKEFLKRQEGELGALPDVTDALKSVDDLREIGGMQRLKENMNRASGGPTGQGANLITQAGLGYGLASMTGGASVPFQIAALPVTNPAGWTRLLDGVDSIMKRVGVDGKYGQLLKKTFDARGPGAVAATHAALIRNDAEYRKLFEEIKSIKGAKQAFDRKLGENIVDPLARAGYPDLGAGLATIPSTLVEAALPSTPMDFSPMPAAVLFGHMPKSLLKKRTRTEVRLLRETIGDKIGNLMGKPHLFAERLPGEPKLPHQWDLNFDEAGREVLTPPEQPSDIMKRVDSWYIKDGRKADKQTGNKIVGVVEIDWGHPVPKTTYYENLSAGKNKGIIQDFLDKFSNRAGKVESTMAYAKTPTATGERYLGQELWEDKLPRVVDANGQYTMLGDREFNEWLSSNPEAASKYFDDANASAPAKKKAR